MEDIIQIILANYQNGSASIAELTALKSLLENDRELVLKYLELYRLENELSELNTTSDYHLENKRRVLDKIEHELFFDVSNTSSIFSRISIYKYLAAAVLILFVSISSILFWYLSNEKKAIVNNKIVAVLKTTNVGHIDTIYNNSGKLRWIRLSDHSVVKLFPKSSIQFYSPFKENERSIYLNGKAIFKVTKNPAKPFVVYSGLVSTTALGTKFLVNNSNKKILRIKLYQGKIWLRKEQSLLKGWQTDMILKPGQELNYYTNGSRILSNFFDIGIKQKLVINVKNEIDSSSLSANSTYEVDSSSIVFHQTKLVNVFQVLSKLYKKTISLNNLDISTKYFSGIIYFNDYLNVVVDNICKMNNLSFSDEQDNIKIFTINRTLQSDSLNTKIIKDTIN